MSSPILIRRMYAVYSRFLDTTIQKECIQEDGETLLVAATRVRREMDAVADEWRREATVNGMVQDVQKHPFIPGQKPTQANPTVIDYKKFEQLEIDIDNTKTPEELEAILKQHDTFPEKLLPLINAKRVNFKIEANNKSMGDKNANS